MSRTPVGRNIRGQLVFLGTGTSYGVPVVGCGCATCRSLDPRNRRTRCSLILGLPEGNLLVDTPPDLHGQLIREQIGVAHAALFTHAHADHLFGLDDVRVFCDYLQGDFPVHCEEPVEARIRQAFQYAFDANTQRGGGLPRLVFRRIDGGRFDVLGATLTPIRLWHGRMPVLGFRLGNLAYCTDANAIADESWPLLEGLDVLILDCLRHRPHPTHFHTEQALEIVARLAPKRTLFTHVGHDLEHGDTNRNLPAGVELAYDGLTLPLNGKA